MKKRVGFGAFFRALGAALQWRLLLLWVVFTLLPTAIVAVPLWGTLGAMTDHSVHAAAWARQFDALAMTDVIFGTVKHGQWLGSAFDAGLVLTLLLSPFLSGMVVAASRAPRALTFGELLHGGLSEYGPLLRLLLWSILPLGVALAIGGIASHIADERAAKLVLQSQADLGTHIAMAVLLGLFVIAHAMVEGGRGQFVAEPSLRSATRAFFRGVALVLRRPLVTLGMYLGTTIAGLVLALLLGMLRMRMAVDSFTGVLLAFLVAQLIVAVLAWMRTARLFAFGAIAAATPPRRGRKNASLAPV